MNRSEVRKPCVYGLHVNGVYFYVGKTTGNAKTRRFEHVSKARSGHKSPVYEYMRAIGIDRVEVTELDDDISQETAWITKLIAAGHPITNQMGRDGVPNSMSPKSKAKIGDANAGNTSWITGKTGDAAGWTEERRRAQAERITQLNKTRRK